MNQKSTSSPLLAMLCVLISGCQPKENPVLSNEQFPGEKYPSNMLLSESQSGDVVAILHATAQGAITDPLTSAAHGVRWSDVSAAANEAISLAEMGVASSKLVGETWTFDIDTQGGEPAKLTVVRRQPPDMYYATATVGSFGERYTEAERIVREFRLAMRRYGALKRPS
jgi:hypothetical protein